MEREQFEALVKRLETVAQENPRGYKSRVLGLALLGYGFIFFVLACLVVFLAGTIFLLTHFRGASYVGGKLAFGLLICIFLILRSLWVKIEPPGGLPLTREMTPDLFSVIDEVATQLNSRKPDVVLLTDEFNCGVAQVPRLGVFGWYREYLVLGLPMLHALPPEEFKAVLAHEFGHLSANHGRFGSWIYRVRAAWYQLLESMQGQHGAGIFGWFFNWYAPYFGAYSFVLARADEYVADRCAAQVSGSRASADALLRTSIAATYLEEKFWPGIFRKADEEQAPPSPFQSLNGALTAFEPEPAHRWVNRAMAELTTGTDTHPSLTDRLAALGETPRVPPAVERSSAQEYLGASLEEITSLLDQAWTQGMSEAWQSRHQEQREAQEKLRELDEKAASGEELSEDEALQRAGWVEEFRSEEEALAAWEAFVEAHPGNLPGHFCLGRVLLARGDEAGVAHIEQAMNAETEAVLPGCQLLYTFWAERGEKEKAHAVFNRAVKESDVLAAAEEERARLTSTDTFLPHDLSEEQLAPLKAALHADGRIKEAYLVRKQVSLSARPLYALGLIFEVKWYQVENEEKFRQWAAELTQSLPFPGECFVLSLHGDATTFKKPLQKPASAQILNRKK